MEEGAYLRAPTAVSVRADAFLSIDSVLLAADSTALAARTVGSLARAAARSASAALLRSSWTDLATSASSSC